MRRVLVLCIRSGEPTTEDGLFRSGAIIFEKYYDKCLEASKL